MPRYIVRAGTKRIRTIGGQVTEELWFGIATDEPLSHLLEYLSRHGYDLVLADGMTADELRSVGVERFEEVLVGEEV